MEKQNRKPITLKDKLEIIEKLEKGCKNAHICREYKLRSSTVSTIWANRNKYLDRKHINMKTRRIRRPERADVDQGLIQWFSSKRLQGVTPISTIILQEKANELNKSSEIISDQPSSSGSNRGDFTCSKSWIDRFKKRYNIRLGKMQGEASSAINKIEITNNWVNDVWPTLRRRFKDCDIFNGTETALFYKLTPDETLKFKDESCIGGKFSNERLTIFVCANMDGSEKIKLSVIGKPNLSCCFKNIQNLSLSYFNNSKAWMTSEIFQKILVDWDLDLQRKNRKILLLVDNFAIHPPISNLECVEIVYFPENSNSTAVLQPMDQGVIKSLKTFYRQKVLYKLEEAVVLNKKFKVDIFDGILMLNSAWGEVAKETIKRCFHQAFGNFQESFSDENKIPLAIQLITGPSTEEDLSSWAEKKGLQMNGVDLNLFATIDDNIAVGAISSDTEIMSDVLNTDNESDTESDEEIVERNVSKNEFLEAFSVVSRYIEINYANNDECMSACSIINRNIRQELLCKNIKQKKVQKCFNKK